jgi:DNA polymerase V
MRPSLDDIPDCSQVPQGQSRARRPENNQRRATGFPSPAEDSAEHWLDLNELLVSHRAATFFVNVKGRSMEGAGISDGDTLIVDRSLQPGNNDVVVALLDGEYTVRRLRRTGNRVTLLSENPDYEPLDVSPQHQFEVWGVVTFVIHPM